MRLHHGIEPARAEAKSARALEIGSTWNLIRSPLVYGWHPCGAGRAGKVYAVTRIVPLPCKQFIKHREFFRSAGAKLMRSGLLAVATCFLLLPMVPRWLRDRPMLAAGHRCWPARRHLATGAPMLHWFGARLRSAICQSRSQPDRRHR
jgi:hypothetical protein